MKRSAVLPVLVGILVLLCGYVLLRPHMPGPLRSAVQRVKGAHTVDDRVAEFGPMVRSRLIPAFEAAGVPYPPGAVVLVGIKAERKLELWARVDEGGFVQVRTDVILGASGELGPKLGEGDRQVPEGIYRVVGLNPNSRFHLSLELDYPNGSDWERARADGRAEPGSEIFIHGGRASIGCLAMGDEVAEDLFVLVEETGMDMVRVVLTPVDFRTGAADPVTSPPWVNDLYAEIRVALAELK